MKNSKPMLIITEVLDSKAEKSRIDKKVSRQYIGTRFAQAIQGANGSLHPNPFRSGFRNIFQQHVGDGMTEARWKVTPDQLKALKKGQLAIPGEIVTKKVKEFPVLVNGVQSKDRNGAPVTASQYSAVVLEGENIDSIFKAAGHEIVGEVESTYATAPALELEA